MKYFILILLFCLNVEAFRTVPITSTRALNTNFQPNTTRTTFVNYTVQISATASVAGGQSGTVILLCDASNPPTTSITRATSSFNITLGVGIAWTSAQAWGLTAFVRPGDYCRLSTSGTATMTIVDQTEWTIEPEFDGVDFSTGFPYK